MECISLYFLQVMEFIIYGTMALALYDNHIKKQKYLHIGLIIFMSLICLFSNQISIEMFSATNVVLITLYLILIFDETILKRIWMSFSVVMVTLIVQIMVINFFDKEMILDEPKFGIVSIALGATILLVAGLIYLIRLRRVKSVEWSSIPVYLYLNITLSFVGTIFPLFSIIWLKEYLPIRMTIAITVVSYLVAICSATTIILYIKNYNERNKYFSENQIKEQLLDMQKKYYLDLVKNYEDIRKFKHDFHGHMRVIKNLEENNNYNELHNYISNIQSEMQKSTSFKCNNIYISAIVNSFILECQESEVLLDVVFDVIGNIKVNNVHLCSLLHNLLSNAIEEQLKIEISNERLIKLRIINSAKALIIHMANNVSKDFNIENIISKKTSKKNSKNHGIGLYNIYNIADIYFGDVKYYYENEKLETNIVLPNCVKED